MGARPDASRQSASSSDHRLTPLTACAYVPENSHVVAIGRIGCLHDRAVHTSTGAISCCAKPATCARRRLCASPGPIPIFACSVCVPRDCLLSAIRRRSAPLPPLRAGLDVENAFGSGAARGFDEAKITLRLGARWQVRCPSYAGAERRRGYGGAVAAGHGGDRRHRVLDAVDPGGVTGSCTAGGTAKATALW